MYISIRVCFNVFAGWHQRLSCKRCGVWKL